MAVRKTTEGSALDTSDKPQVVNLDDDAFSAQVGELDEATNKRLLRKIDWRLMPVVSIPSALRP